MFFHSRLIILLTVLVLFATLANAQTNKENVTFSYGDFGYPSSLEPVTANQPSECHLCQFVFDSLVVQNSEGEFVFSLAKDLDISPDGLAYTFLLKEDIKWSDGTLLTSKDVESTLGLMLNPETDNYNTMLGRYIEDVLCITPYTITITLSRPFYSPLSLFTFKIVPKHKLSGNCLKKTDPFIKNPLGSGPFRYVKKKKTDDTQKETITLSQNPLFNYRRKPFLEKIVVKIYDDKSKALSDLLQKEVNMITEVEPAGIVKLEKQQEFALKRYKNRTIHFIAFNHCPDHRYHELFQDYRFRRALLQATDRQKILQDVFFAGNTSSKQDGQAHAVISGPFPVGSWAYNDKIAPFPFDLPYARQLLKEVLITKEYKQDADLLWKKENGERIRLTLKYPAGDQTIEQACQRIAKSVQELKIVLDLEKKDSREFMADVMEHNFDLIYTKYTFDNTMDAFPLFDPSQTGKGQSNFSGYVDSRLAELFYQLHNTLNPWMLRSVSHQIHKIVHDETVHLFLWQLDLYAAHHRKIKNLKLHPYYLFNFPEDWKIIED